MRKTLFVLALAASFAACTGEGPTAPDPVSTPAPPPASTVGPPTVVTPDPTPAPAKDWWWSGGFGANGSYDFLNRSGEAITWTVYSTSFDDQVTVLSAFTTTTRNGDRFSGTLDVRCRQVDAQQGVVKVGEKATAAPFSSAFINGYGQPVPEARAREGCAPAPQPTPSPEPSPEPTPQPTPSPSPSPSPSPTPPPSCESINPPTFGSFVIDADDSGNNQSIKASVQISNAGTWKLELYAASQQSEYPNNPDYVKQAVTKTLKCGERFTLVNEYDWKNHQSDEWWFKLYLNGSLKATSARIHKD